MALFVCKRTSATQIISLTQHGYTISQESQVLLHCLPDARPTQTFKQPP